jgi:hypothetical protein
VNILGRVFFIPKWERAIDWFKIAYRLQEISARAGPADFPVDPSLTLTNDLAAAHDLPATDDRPVTDPGDPLEMLSLLSEISISRSPCKGIIPDFPDRNRSICFNIE